MVDPSLLRIAALLYSRPLSPLSSQLLRWGGCPPSCVVLFLPDKLLLSKQTRLPQARLWRLIFLLTREKPDFMTGTKDDRSHTTVPSLLSMLQLGHMVNPGNWNAAGKGSEEMPSDKKKTSEQKEKNRE